MLISVLHLQYPASVRGSVLGVLFPILWVGAAEIIPVEPDQGNACAGKVSQISDLSSFALQHFPQNQFFNPVKGKRFMA